jgi:hypothetical protein
VEDFSSTQAQGEAGLLFFSITITVMIVRTSIWLRLSHQHLPWIIFTAKTIKNSAFTLKLTGTTFMTMSMAQRRSPPVTGILASPKALTGLLQFHNIVFSWSSHSIGSSLAPAQKIGPIV